MAESLGIAEPVLVARLVEELEELVSSGGVTTYTRNLTDPQRSMDWRFGEVAYQESSTKTGSRRRVTLL